jgi:DNA-directed RNA polymerase III subunit RPC3
LLLLKRQLEQKQIAEEAMIPVKDTRELLYKLFKVEFVQLQEVARTADHSPSRTFYLWRVDLLRVIDKISGELYRTISKVRARLLHELQREAEVLAQHAVVQASGGTLTAEEHSRLRRVKHVAGALEVSLMRLDNLSLLFCDV